MPKAKETSTASASRYKSSPAPTPEAREAQLIALAYDELERRLRDGTATSQEITTLIKAGTTREKMERERLSLEMEQIKAKTEQLRSGQEIEQLYAQAIKAMREYSGESVPEDEYPDIQ